MGSPVSIRTWWANGGKTDLIISWWVLRLPSLWNGRMLNICCISPSSSWKSRTSGILLLIQLSVYMIFIVIIATLLYLPAFWLSLCRSFHLFDYYLLEIGVDGKASARNAGALGSFTESGRSPGEGNANPLQYSCLENPVNRGAWCPWGHKYLIYFIH